MNNEDVLVNHSNKNDINIAVLGCGPAGIVTALGLAKMGYKVCVIATLRQHHVTEGISERVYQALKHANLHNALTEISDPIPRSVSWNGSHSAANTERLIRRVPFDKALLKDLADAGIKFHQESITEIIDLANESNSNESGAKSNTEKKAENKKRSEYAIACKSGKRFISNFVVEARGRTAPVAKSSHIKGAESLSICQNWTVSDQPISDQVPSGNVQSSKSDLKRGSLMSPEAIAISIENGWLWLANNGKGNIFTQVSVSSNSKNSASSKAAASNNTNGTKESLSSYIHKLVFSQPELAHIIPYIKPDGKVLARSSTPILNKTPIKDHMICVGDAAMSVDPLSGNGIFQSLSSALIAPIVINTILQRPQSKNLAQTLYIERLHHLFYRFSRIGRDFYKMESRWQNQNFWQERCAWPDQQPAHQAQDRIIGVEKRGVINGEFIEEKEVVITAEQPLGIWKINNKDATSVLAAKLSQNKNESEKKSKQY